MIRYSKRKIFKFVIKYQIRINYLRYLKIFVLKINFNRNNRENSYSLTKC